MKEWVLSGEEGSFWLKTPEKKLDFKQTYLRGGGEGSREKENPTV